MSKTSSDVTPWLPETCCRCGQRIVRSRQGFAASFAGTGSVRKPEPAAWHMPVCPDPPHRDLGPKVKAS